MVDAPAYYQPFCKSVFQYYLFLMSLINLQIFISFFFRVPKKKQGTATPNGELRIIYKKPILSIKYQM